MNRSLAHKIFIEAAVVLAAFYMLAGVAILFGGLGSGGFSVPVASLGVFSAGALILAGVWVTKRSPWLGGILVVIGAVPLFVRMSWIIFTPIFPILLGIFFIVRATRFVRERRAKS